MTPEQEQARALRSAAAKVLEGFERGIFVRATDGDHAPEWATKLLPYIQALTELGRAIGSGDALEPHSPPPGDAAIAAVRETLLRMGYEPVMVKHLGRTHYGATAIMVAQNVLALGAAPTRTVEAPRASPDSIEAVSIEPLTEYESVQAAAVFHDLNRHDDPLALVRTIEHVLKMRKAAR